VAARFGDAKASGGHRTELERARADLWVQKRNLDD